MRWSNGVQWGGPMEWSNGVVQWGPTVVQPIKVMKSLKKLQKSIKRNQINYNTNDNIFRAMHIELCMSHMFCLFVLSMEKLV